MLHARRLPQARASGRRDTLRREPAFEGGITARARDKKPSWAGLSSDELLDVRLCDLGLSIEGSPLQPRIQRLYEELGQAGLRFRPYVWLSSDWFTPDGHTGFAVPFFLAHPRLAQLERRNMFEVEGGNRPWCMKLLRHETAHALDNAYHLRRRKRWRELFGPVSKPYRSSYVPEPSSRSHVLNLDYWYAQSHPVEDFAETFAVWLQPGSRWRTTYRGWPALAKLRYVDDLITEVGPSSTSRCVSTTGADARNTTGPHTRTTTAICGGSSRMTQPMPDGSWPVAF
jgi:hypothetical protein